MLGLPVATKPIAQIQNGDRVATRNPVTGQTEFKRVVATKVRTTDTLIVLALADKDSGKVVETITTTPQHPFNVAGKGFTAAIHLAVGNAIVTRAGPALIVQSITPQAHPEGVLVYNFEVEDDHTYFVGTANGGHGYIMLMVVPTLLLQRVLQVATPSPSIFFAKMNFKD